jgi:S-DNA-T family DNA segregation ATPase FtsK/SpoIIIE
MKIYQFFHHQKLKKDLTYCFKRIELFKKIDENYKVFPRIKRVDSKKDYEDMIFVIPRGMEPEKVTKKEYVFRQQFGNEAELTMINDKTFRVRVYHKNYLKGVLPYNLCDYSEAIKDYVLPIVLGTKKDGSLFVYDMIKRPHILIAGETGSGKSVCVCSILTTLCLTKTPEQLQMYLFDLKMSEFFIFDGLPHVVENTEDFEIIRERLDELKDEMERRGRLLKKERVRNYCDLKTKIPTILVCIDEFGLLQDEDAILDLIQRIGSIGRALGVFIMLSTQRPSSDIVDGKIKINLTTRVGGRLFDSTNSKIVIDQPGCENITEPGHMIVKSIGGLIDVKVPFLDEQEAEKLLLPLVVKRPKIQNQVKKQIEAIKKVTNVIQPEEIEWGVLS